MLANNTTSAPAAHLQPSTSSTVEDGEHAVRKAQQTPMAGMKQERERAGLSGSDGVACGFAMM